MFHRPPPPKATSSRARRPAQSSDDDDADEDDDDDEEAPQANVTKDSIMDSSSEDEDDDEVDNILLSPQAAAVGPESRCEAQCRTSTIYFYVSYPLLQCCTVELVLYPSDRPYTTPSPAEPLLQLTP